jgi:hypothetical protein
MLTFYRDIGPGYKQRILFGSLHNEFVPPHNQFVPPHNQVITLTIQHNMTLYYYDDWEFEEYVILKPIV